MNRGVIKCVVQDCEQASLPPQLSQETTASFDSNVLRLKQVVLQGMEHALTQQREFSSAIPHALDEFQFIHFSFYQTVIER